jgi:hypothetical protein
MFDKEVAMDFKRLIGMFTLAALLVLPFTFSTSPVAAQGQSQWDRQAEENFRLGRGMGRQLMTEKEWQEHRQKMQSMSPEERQKYREEWHTKMVERARERGITLPETPGPHGPGRGMGQGGGMGSGGGMGQGGRY